MIEPRMAWLSASLFLLPVMKLRVVRGMIWLMEGGGGWGWGWYCYGGFVGGGNGGGLGIGAAKVGSLA